MKEGGYMTIRNLILRILHASYPAMVIAFVMLVWSSSNLAEVVHDTSTPFNEGFSFLWNPVRAESRVCNQHQSSKLKFKQNCSIGSSDLSLEQFGSRSSNLTTQNSLTN